MARARALSIARVALLPVLLLLLGAAGALALLHGNGGYGWPDSALVVVDGEPHQVAVQAGRRTMLWTYDFDATPACTMADAGGLLPLTAARGGYQAAGGGTAGDWVGTATFVPTSDQVTVTCSGANSLVAVHTAPTAAPRSMGARLGHAGAALALGVMALLAATLLVGFSYDRRHHPRPDEEEPARPMPPREPPRRGRPHRPSARVPGCTVRHAHARRPSSTRHH